MKKILLTLAAVLCCWVTLCAQPLTEQQAMERALQYMNSGKASAKARRMAAPVNGGSMQLEVAPVEADRIYAFNIEGGGYVIASSDLHLVVMLGYNDYIFTKLLDLNIKPGTMTADYTAYFDSSSHSTDDVATLTIYDVYGRVAHRSRHSAHPSDLELPDLPRGRYFVLLGDAPPYCVIIQN